MKTVDNISVIEHTWLDYSVSYFLEIDGTQMPGEISSKKEAIESAKALSGKNEINIKKRNELF